MCLKKKFLIWEEMEKRLHIIFNQGMKDDVR
jgi:hypothetical protein